jgi:hypothetical protein
MSVMYCPVLPAGTTRRRRTASSRSTGWRCAPLVSEPLQPGPHAASGCAARESDCTASSMQRPFTPHPRFLIINPQSLPSHRLCCCTAPCTAPAGILVDDAAEAYRIATENGGVGVRPPVTLTDAGSGQRQMLAEIKLYGDCVLRFVSGDFEVGGWVGG